MDNFVAQHPWLFYAITVVLGLVVAWFIRQWFSQSIKALAEITASVSDLYNKYNNIEHRLSTIEGEHNVLSRRKGHGE